MTYHKANRTKRNDLFLVQTKLLSQIVFSVPLDTVRVDTALHASFSWIIPFTKLQTSTVILARAGGDSLQTSLVPFIGWTGMINSNT